MILHLVEPSRDGPTADQARALTAITSWLRAPPGTMNKMFLLQGKAGVGKTWTVIKVVAYALENNLRVVVLTPTHKSMRVILDKLSAAGIRTGPAPTQEDGTVSYGTLQACLGMEPDYEDAPRDTRNREPKFAFTGSGFGTDYDLCVVDECSMVGRALLVRYRQLPVATMTLFCGDRGQLTPVGDKPFPFDDFRHAFEINEIVRQQADSPIIQLASDLRAGLGFDRARREFAGDSRLRFSSDIEDKFIREWKPRMEFEQEIYRHIFLCRTNIQQRRVNDSMCRMVYGHRRWDYAAGERVIMRQSVFKSVRHNDRWSRHLCAANAEEVTVVRFSDERDPQYGRLIELQPDNGPSFSGYPDIHEVELKMEYEGYFDKLDDLWTVALVLIQQWKRAVTFEKYLETAINYHPANHRLAIAERMRLEDAKKKAWSAFFAHKNKALALAHIFACTVHRSQGVTVKGAYVDASSGNQHSLYTACTRPSDHLVIGGI